MAFAAGLFVMAGVILNRRLRRDAVLAGRMRDVQRSAGIEAVVAPAQASLPRALRLIAGIGEAITRGGLLSANTLEDLEARLAAAGFRGRTALASFIGAKLVALIGMPLLGWLMVERTEWPWGLQLMGIAVASLAGMMLPDYAGSVPPQATSPGCRARSAGCTRHAGDLQ